MAKRISKTKYRTKAEKYAVVLDLVRVARATKRDPVRLKRELFKRFSALGGVYVKFLQILALNEAFMADWGGSTEMNVFEAVPYDDLDIQALLRSELKSKNSQITHITPQPTASGSFAQIYRGVLDTGDQIIIKVLKPSVVANLKSDMKFITNIARIIDRAYKNPFFKFKDAAIDLRKTALREIDYHTEVSNIMWFYDNINMKEVKIPKVYPELCTGKIIVEEYIEGLSLASAMQAQAEGHDIVEYVKQKTGGSDLWIQMQTLGSSFLLSMLGSKYVFGDPHPGNIFLLPENKIALIDFGIVVKGPKDTTYIHQLIQEYLNIYEGKFNPGPFAVGFIGLFDSKLMQALQTFARIHYPNAQARVNQILERAVNMVMQEVGENKSTTDFLSDVRFIKLFSEVINQGNRFGVHIDPSGTQMHKAMMVFTQVVTGIGRKYPDKPHLTATKKGMQYALSHTSSGPSTSLISDRSSMSEEEATERVINWLAEIAVNDPVLYKSLGAMIKV